jgi:hypothetical protein
MVDSASQLPPHPSPARHQVGGAALVGLPVLEWLCRRGVVAPLECPEESDALLLAAVVDRVDREPGGGARLARAERDWVLAELAAGTGLGGQPRAFSAGNYCCYRPA